MITVPLGAICYPGDIVRCRSGVGVVVNMQIDHELGLADRYDIWLPDTNTRTNEVCWNVETVPFDEASETCRELAMAMAMGYTRGRTSN